MMLPRYWLEFYNNPGIARDNEGFRGAEQLWIPSHKMRFRSREPLCLLPGYPLSDMSFLDENSTCYKPIISVTKACTCTAHEAISPTIMGNVSKYPCQVSNMLREETCSQFINLRMTARMQSRSQGKSPAPSAGR